MLWVISILIILNFIFYILGEFNYLLKILQQKEYSFVSFFKRKKINIKFKIVLMIIGFCLFIFTIVNEEMNIILILFLLINLIFNFYNYQHLKEELPKYTKRIVRCIFVFILLFLCAFIHFSLCDKLSSVAYLLLLLFDLLTITMYIMTNTYEKILLFFNTKKAIKKLSCTNLIKIAIVGSYGKTSVKNILCKILQEKYSVIMTPESYNTPNGLAITINNNDMSKYQVFIMEMGAKRKGDIDWLCKRYKPDFAIFTSIGKQHLESFKSIENIINTKSEILKYVKMCVFNGDNDYVKKLSNCFDNDKVEVGDGCEIYASNKILNVDRSQFDIFHKGEFFCNAETELVGDHNITNILLAVGMAIKLNLTAKQIKKGINSLYPIKSRMEKIILSNGATVINNGYNSNPDTAKKSIDLLRLYDNRNKIIITPGFVEMGESQYGLNYDFGCLIADNADCCIVVNKVNRSAIVDAFVNKGFSNYKFVDKFKDISFSDFTKDDVVLIENDLPDSYE